MKIRLIYTLLLICSWVSLRAETFTVDGITYTTLSADAVKVVAGSEKYTGHVVIPETVTYEMSSFNVTQIGASAFKSCTGLESVTLPQSIVLIGNNAFQGCTSMASPILPPNITSIGEYAFQNCDGITEIDLPAGVTVINQYAFDDCNNLTRIGMPPLVTSIGVSAFRYTESLKSITLGEGLKEIGNYCFNGSGIEEVNLPSTLTKIGNYAFKGCLGLTSAVIPANVTSLGTYLFQNCIIERADILASVNTLPSHIFDGCASLRTVNLSPDITTIGSYSFNACNSLEHYTVPSTVTTISTYAFYNCRSLQSVTLHNNLTSIGSNAFNGCTALEQVVLPASITKFDASVFYGCTSLRYADFSALTLTSVPSRTFYGCTSLSEVLLPQQITTIDTYAFYNCSSLDLHGFPAALTSVKTYAFYGSGINGINLPEGTVSVADNAFENCVNAASVTLPASLTTLGVSVFLNCTGLRSAEIKSPLTSIPKQTFKGCASLAEVILPETVTSFAGSAFYGCRGLTSFTFPPEFKSFGMNVFTGCTGLEQITIPEGVTSLTSALFSDCTSLSKVVIGKDVTSIAGGAFANCTALVEVEVRTAYPPTMPSGKVSSSRVFPDEAYNNATLKVNIYTTDAYRAIPKWDAFVNIVEVDYGFESDFDTADWNALLSLYDKLKADGWTEVWHTEAGPNAAKNFTGVTVDDNHVTGLSLSAAKVSSETIPYLLDFPNLLTLDISNNSLSGDIAELFPDEFKATGLTTLNISNNSLSGNLADINDIFPSLTSLNASYNRFSVIDPYISAQSLKFSSQIMDGEVHWELGDLDGYALCSQFPSAFRYNHSTKSLNDNISFYITNGGTKVLRFGTTTDGKVKYYNIGDNFSVFRLSMPDCLDISPDGTNNYSSGIRIYVTHKTGDANINGVCDITDLQNTVNYALGFPRSNAVFNEKAVNFCADETINVLDVIGLVNFLLDTPAEAPQQRIPQTDASHGATTLSLAGGMLSLSSDVPAGCLDFTIDGATSFLLSPELAEAGYTCSQRQHGSSLRVLVYTLDAAEIPAGECVIGYADAGMLTRAMMATPDAQGVQVTTRSTTSIDSINAGITELTFGAAKISVPAEYIGGGYALYDSAGALLTAGTLTDATALECTPGVSLLVITKTGLPQYTVKVTK